MKYIKHIFVLAITAAAILAACKKQPNNKTTGDPRLTNPYCNDPTAVNYNWGFPGVPDNTVCFYPTDVFKGVYELHDSVFLRENGYFVSADTIEVTIRRHSNTKFSLIGFCTNGDSLELTATPIFTASIDTVIGDSTTRSRGYRLCSVADTISGTLTKDRLNDSFFSISFVVASDTGVVTTHIGTAKLKYKY